MHWSDLRIQVHISERHFSIEIITCEDNLFSQIKNEVIRFSRVRSIGANATPR
jgi:hypothetical protein